MLFPSKPEFYGCLVYNSSAQAADSDEYLSFSNAEYQKGGTFWEIANDTRITVPDGFQYAEFQCQVVSDHNLSAGYKLEIRKNGSAAEYNGKGHEKRYNAQTGVDFTLDLQTAIIPVSANDYFEVHINTTSQTLEDYGVWFAGRFYR